LKKASALADAFCFLREVF